MGYFDAKTEFKNNYKKKPSALYILYLKLGKIDFKIHLSLNINLSWQTYICLCW